MKCPVCADTNLVMSERQGIEIDYCPQCRGIWLDRGELDKLIERTLAVMPGGVPQHEAPVAPPATQHGYYPEPRQAHPDAHRHRHRKRRGFLGDLFDFD